MAKGTVTRGTPLNMRANLSVEDAVRNANTLIKKLNELKSASSSPTGGANASGVNNMVLMQGRMTKAMRESLAETQRLTQEGVRLRNEYEQGRISAQQLTAQTRALNQQRRDEAAALKLARLSQRAATGSYQEAQNRLKQLGIQIRSVAGGFEATGRIQQARIREYRELNARLLAFDRTLGNHQRNVGNYAGIIGGVSNTLVSLAASYLSVNAAISGISKIVSNNAKISDSLADVRRTAELTEGEADNLLETFKKFDTRTNLKGLLDIAGIGGQIGIAKNDLEGFTRAIDQLAIVLSNEIPGGASAVASALGKINGVFKVQKTEGTSVEESFKRTGSAILKLGQEGLATGEFLQDFTLRVAGAAQASKISLPTILAYGSVLEEAGSSAEVAGTSLNRLIGTLSTKRDKFFAIAKLADSNLTLKEFTNIINTDANAALQLFFKGLNQGNPSLTEFNDRLDTIGIKAGPSKNAILALAQNQDILVEKIKSSRTAYLDTNIVSDQAAIKNDTLAASIDKIHKTFENATTSGGISRFFKAIVDGSNYALQAIEDLATAMSRTQDEKDDKIISSADRGGWFNKMLRTESDDQRLAEARERRRARWLSNFTEEINGRGSSTADILAAGKEEAEIRKILTGEINKQSEAQKRLNYNLAYIKDPKNVGAPLDAQIAKTNNLRVALAQQDAVVARLRSKLPEKTITKINTENNGDDRTTEVIKAEIKELVDANKKLDITSEVFKGNVNKIKALRKELKLALGGKDTEGIAQENQYQTALKSRNDLQKKINDLIKKGTDKQLSADDQELESVKKKYDDMRAEAIKFNKDPKNRAKGLKVDGGNINVAEEKERIAVVDKQDAAKLKDSFEIQKKIYDDFERYKTQVGEETAIKRYKDRIDTDRTYLQKLQEQEEKFNPQKSKGGDSVDIEGNQLKLKLLNDLIAAEREAQEKKDDEIYANALRAAMTFKDKAIAIENDYQLERASLEKNGAATPERLANLDKEKRERYRNIADENAYAESGYAELMARYDEMTRGQILRELEAVKEGYRKRYLEGVMVNGKLIKLTAEQYAGLINQINQQIDKLNGVNSFKKITQSVKDYKKALEDAKGNRDALGVQEAKGNMYEAIAKGAKEAGQVVDALASSFQDLGIGGENLQQTLKNVNGALDGFGSILSGLKPGGNPVDIITGSIKLLTSAVSLFNTKDKRLEKQIKRYQADLDSLGKSYKQLERDVQNAAGNEIYSKQADEIANLQEQQQKLIQIRDAEANKKKKDQGKINDLNNQIDDIPNKIADIQASISQNLIQGTFRELSSSLADALTSAFQAGEDGIAAMDKTLDAFIANAIKGGLRIALLEQPIKAFTDDLAKYASANNNSVIGFDFDKYKEQLKDAGKLFNDALEGSKDFFESSDSAAKADSMRGRIESITAPQADKLVAVQTGIQFGIIQTNALLKPIGKTLGDFYLMAKDNFDIAVKTEQNTRRTADNTDNLKRLERVEAALISIDNKMDKNANYLQGTGRGG